MEQPIPSVTTGFPKMRIRLSRLAVPIVAALCATVAACTNDQTPPQATQPAARLSEPGTLLGALLASEVGAGVRESDVPLAQQAAIQAHSTRVGAEVTWKNPETGNSGAITPVREGYAPDGRFCREYQQSVTAQGRTGAVFGITCRQPDGGWRLASN